jgi:hypothetical protein
MERPIPNLGGSVAPFLLGAAPVQHHSEQRTFTAVRTLPVAAELRCDVHLVEMRGTG